MKNQEEKRIGNTRMAIYATQIGTGNTIQSTMYSPSRKYWKSEPTTGSNRMWENCTRTISSDLRLTDATSRQQEAEEAMSIPVSISDEKCKNLTALINIESDSDQEIQIISEQMMTANNEPTHKKIRLSVDKGTEHDKKENYPTNKGYDEHVQNDIRNLNETVSNFDEKAASETLLLLSGSSSNNEDVVLETDNKEINQDIPEPEETSTSSLFSLPVLCPCEAARRLGNISLEENQEDEESFADFTAKLGTVLTKVLGESRLGQLGYPGLSGREVLEKVLRLTGTTVTREDDLCSQDCKDQGGNDVQREFRLLKSRLIALEMNTEAFLKICTPDQDLGEFWVEGKEG